MKLKLPNLTKFRSLRWPQRKTRPVARLRPPSRFNAATRRAAPQAIDDYGYDEQPTTKLSSAFFIVLILHVVAVGGIYAFNSIKAHRRNREMPPPATSETSASTRPSSSTSPERVESNNALPAMASTTSRTGTTPMMATTGAAKTASGARATPLKSLPVTDAKRAEFLAAHHNEDAAVLRPPTKAATSDKTYKVAKGDTVYSIAKKLNVSADDLMKANKIEDSKKLQIAQTLKIPAKKTE